MPNAPASQNSQESQTPYYFTDDEIYAALRAARDRRIHQKLSRIPFDKRSEIITKMALLTKDQIDREKPISRLPWVNLEPGSESLGLRLRAVLKSLPNKFPENFKELQSKDVELGVLGACLLAQGISCGIVTPGLGNCPSLGLKDSPVYNQRNGEYPRYPMPSPPAMTYY